MLAIAHQESLGVRVCSKNEKPDELATAATGLGEVQRWWLPHANRARLRTFQKRKPRPGGDGAFILAARVRKGSDPREER